MQIVKLSAVAKENRTPISKETAGGNLGYRSSLNQMEDGEMRLAFFSKGNIFLESGEATFEIENSQGISLSQTDCFGQLITVNFEKLFSECSHFRYNGSPVRFTVSFYNKTNNLLATLISDSIFKNIGFGKGEGSWKTK
jgi:hypothetical protein